MGSTTFTTDLDNNHYKGLAKKIFFTRGLQTYLSLYSNLILNFD